MSEYKPLISNVEGLRNKTILQELEQMRQYVVANAVKGDKGDTGERGPQGTTIVSMTAGTPRIDGNRTITPITVVYNTGESTTYEVSAQKGATGAQGERGERGETGATGRGIVEIQEGTPIDNGDYTFTPLDVEYTDGTSETIEIAARHGAQGERGETGAQGERGETGATGATGLTGAPALQYKGLVQVEQQLQEGMTISYDHFEMSQFSRTPAIGDSFMALTEETIGEDIKPVIATYTLMNDTQVKVDSYMETTATGGGGGNDNPKTVYTSTVIVRPNVEQSAPGIYNWCQGDISFCITAYDPIPTYPGESSYVDLKQIISRIKTAFSPGSSSFNLRLPCTGIVSIKRTELGEREILFPAYISISNNSTTQAAQSSQCILYGLIMKNGVLDFQTEIGIYLAVAGVSYASGVCPGNIYPHLLEKA